MQNKKQIKNRKLNRLKGYDYSRDGWYFVTICIKDRIKCLGKIENGKMILDKYGKIAKKYWSEIPDHYNNVFLDEWIIMPNHIHGIIVIENDDKTITATVGTGHCPVPTTVNTGSKYGLLSKTVKSFKEISLKTIRKQFNDFEFSWQRSFYDHIIRDEKSLEKIRNYIANNPLKWETDRNNQEKLLM